MFGLTLVKRNYFTDLAVSLGQLLRVQLLAARSLQSNRKEILTTQHPTKFVSQTDGFMNPFNVGE
jgi:hypothetical protein